nr:LacI family DNA-binding transcriptional regulator [Rubellimicrobium arenae]
MRPKPTLRDIARLSGASTSTVSSVLSGTWQARRISEITAERIRSIAGAQGYSTNRQARGLRRGQSELAGLILPMHDNRFFAAITQSFEAEARARNLCPVVVSTLRDPREEIRTVERLISQAIDFLVIAGATDPAAIGALCRAGGVRHVYLDLPGHDAPSVVSDNRAGAALLTETILDRMESGTAGPRGRPYFLGGAPADAATARRIEGFREVVAARLGPVDPDQVIACGYAPSRARAEIAALRERLGGLPVALFVNAITVFEGVLTHIVTLPPAEIEGCVIGCYDHDPIASFLPFPVHMIRQNSEALVARAFELIDAEVDAPLLVEIAPDLVPPRSIHSTRFDLG